jgi:H+/Cl- antiporter ClcA
MPLRWDAREHLTLGWYLLRWTAIVAPVAAATGSLVALFLWLLDVATKTRWQHPSLLWFLPLAGVAIVLVYHRFGKESEGGNNLVMDRIHEPGGGVPKRMAPLVLIGTVVTHLFGGSAGREGTAVQMGGSVAQAFADLFRLSKDDTRTLLMCGIAAGFGAVFGTPLTGALFAVEVLALGRMRHAALIPCLVASIGGDLACTAWGIGHTHYEIALPGSYSGHGLVALDPLLVGKVALASIAFGLASVLFAELSHSLSALFKRYVPVIWLRPIIGAAVVLGITWVLGTRDYLGLGVTTADGGGVSIVNAFREGGATSWSWFWKIILTAVTISSGFKGGEVTPLFFVGATLGNVLGGLMGVPVDLMAGLGFIAVFSGATNTPLACTVMGIELFGSEYAIYFAMACFLAYLFSGHSGIYLSQRVGIAKGELVSGEDHPTLRSVREGRTSLLPGAGEGTPRN